MGMKVKILNTTFGRAIEHVLMTSVIGGIYQVSERYEGNVKVIIDKRGFWMLLGVEVTPYKEEIFSDKEYEELWV